MNSSENYGLLFRNFLGKIGFKKPASKLLTGFFVSSYGVLNYSKQ